MSELFAVHGCVLQPAYGRDYKSRKEAIEDFRKGNTFILRQFGDKPDQYIGVSSIKPGTRISIRYKKNTQVTPEFVV